MKRTIVLLLLVAGWVGAYGWRVYYVKHQKPASIATAGPFNHNVECIDGDKTWKPDADGACRELFASMPSFGMRVLPSHDEPQKKVTPKHNHAVNRNSLVPPDWGATAVDIPQSCSDSVTPCQKLYDFISNPDIGNSTSVIAQLAPGPFVEIITVDKGKPIELLRISDADKKVLITVHMDGTVTTDNGFQADEEAKIFWKALATLYSPVCHEVFDKSEVRP